MGRVVGGETRKKERKRGKVSDQIPGGGSTGGYSTEGRVLTDMTPWGGGRRTSLELNRGLMEEKPATLGRGPSSLRRGNKMISEEPKRTWEIGP